MSRDKRFNQGIASLLTREDFAEIASEQRKQMNERNRAGAKVRADKYTLIKKFTHKIFIRLCNKNQESPSLKIFLREFEHSKPDDIDLSEFEKQWWKLFISDRKGESTITRYWKKFRKDLDINN